MGGASQAATALQAPGHGLGQAQHRNMLDWPVCST